METSPSEQMVFVSVMVIQYNTLLIQIYYCTLRILLDVFLTRNVFLVSKVYNMALVVICKSADLGKTYLITNRLIMLVFI